LCRKLKLQEDFDYQKLARLTPGYVGADLMALCREAAMSAVSRVLLEMRGQSKGRSSTEELLTSGAQTEAVTDGEVGEVGEVGEQPVTDVKPVPQESEPSHLQVWELPQYTSKVPLAMKLPFGRFPFAQS